MKRFRIFLENVLRDEGKEDEFRMNDSSNGERYCRFSMNKLPPEMTGDLFIIVTDVTERKNFDRIMISKTFEIEEMEKAKLASDLHDDMGPTLSAIKMQLTLLSSERPNEILTSCDEMLNDCISRMRSLANNISPKAVETYGLEAALSSFIEKIEKGQQIQFNFSSNLADNRFPREIEIHLYRVLTELITNTIKHVGKARVTIDLKLHDAVIEVFYADNGPGYSVENKPTASSGSGLLNIKSRVSIMNGRIDFINRDGHTGVMITVDFSK